MLIGIFKCFILYCFDIILILSVDMMSRVHFGHHLVYKPSGFFIHADKQYIRLGPKKVMRQDFGKNILCLILNYCFVGKFD